MTNLRYWLTVPVISKDNEPALFSTLSKNSMSVASNFLKKSF